MFEKIVNKVNKEELINSLNTSIMYNDDALDYIVIRKRVVEDMLKYNANDTFLQDELNVLRYIEITLEHVGSMYEDNLKKVQ